MSLHDFTPSTKLGHGLLTRGRGYGPEKLTTAEVDESVALYRNARRAVVPGYELTPEEQADVAHIKARLTR